MHIFIVSPYFDTIDVFWKNSYKKRLGDLFKEIKRANLVNKVENLHVVGIHGEQFTMNYNKWLGPKWFDNKLIELKGTLGCALSHLKILHEIKRLELKEDVLVIEDDCILHPNFLNLIPSFPPDYDLLHMFTWCKNCYANLDSLNSDLYPNLKKITKDSRFGNDAWGTYTYFVNGRKIDHIINSIIPLQDTIDNNIIGGFNPKLNSYLLDPKLKASGDKPLSIRKWINSSYIKYDLNIIQEENTKYLCENSEIKIAVNPTMIYDVDRNNIFRFVIETEDERSIEIDNYINIVFPQENSNFSEIKIRFLNLKSILKNGNSYKLNIFYIHPDGKVFGTKKQTWPEMLSYCKSNYINYGEIIHKVLSFKFVF